jgi:hypothetical protein
MATPAASSPAPASTNAERRTANIRPRALTGRPPMSVREFVSLHAEEFGGRSVSGRP